MKPKFIDQTFTYDGTQLRSLFAYLEYEILGDSIVSWCGPCNISFAEMVDGEDLLAKAEIRGDNMLHFIVEKFSCDLFSAVALQRLLTSLCIESIEELSTLSVENQTQNPLNRLLTRNGDDIYGNEQKLSISIATVTPVSGLIHFAVNITNEGTPVPTLSLGDLNIEPQDLANILMKKFCHEVETITEATQKVFPR